MAEADLEDKITDLRQRIRPSIEGDTAIEGWCTDQCLRRYLVARKLDVNKAQKMLLNTIQWRKSYKPGQIRWEDIKEEARTGKVIVYHSRDLDGRGIVLMRPRNENSKNVARQIQHLVYVLEYISEIADQTGEGKMTWLIDFEGYSMSNAPPPSVGIQTLSILQNHYPERLGLSVLYHPPWLFNLTWKAVSPFIDPVTSKKVHFCAKGEKGQATMARFFDMSKMETCVGGTSEKNFDFDAYDKQQIEREQAAQQKEQVNGIQSH